ncbi:MAG: glycosyltransferase family 4 protein, partial [Leptotrichiaceae bacterium]|nr:glycosyltransferase family 4 protein [Leptotrichiaceae bacterium]
MEYTLNPDEDYDIVHINTLGIKSWRVLKKAKKNKKPVIYHTHTTYEDFKGSVKGSNQLAPIIKFWAKKSYNGADYLISPTEYTKNLITEKYLTEEKEIRVISNGVSTDKIRKDEELKKIFLKKYKINRPLIITAGLPFERKGIREFVKIVERCSDYQFLWFGSSSIKSMLPKRIQKIIENPPKNLIF